MAEFRAILLLECICYRASETVFDLRLSRDIADFSSGEFGGRPMRCATSCGFAVHREWSGEVPARAGRHCIARLRREVPCSFTGAASRLEVERYLRVTIDTNFTKG